MVYIYIYLYVIQITGLVIIQPWTWVAIKKKFCLSECQLYNIGGGALNFIFGKYVRAKRWNGV